MMQQTRWPTRLYSTILMLSLGICGCGFSVNSNFANRVVGADGQLFVVEDLETIANDTSLSNEEKKQQFRDLGIEDEKLIDALLGF